MEGRQGLRIEATDLAELRDAMHVVVDYRGDLTITRRSGDAPVTGYVFDFSDHADDAKARIRLLAKDGDEKVSIPLADVAAIEFTGRDTAVGKSFETWVRKYVEKKRSGENASLYGDDEPG